MIVDIFPIPWKYTSPGPYSTINYSDYDSGNPGILPIGRSIQISNTNLFFYKFVEIMNEKLYERYVVTTEELKDFGNSPGGVCICLGIKSIDPSDPLNDRIYAFTKGINLVLSFMNGSTKTTTIAEIYLRALEECQNTGWFSTGNYSIVEANMFKEILKLLVRYGISCIAEDSLSMIEYIQINGDDPYNVIDDANSFQIFQWKDLVSYCGTLEQTDALSWAFVNGDGWINMDKLILFKSRDCGVYHDVLNYEFNVLCSEAETWTLPPAIVSTNYPPFFNSAIQYAFLFPYPEFRLRLYSNENWDRFIPRNSGYAKYSNSIDEVFWKRGVSHLKSILVMMGNAISIESPGVLPVKAELIKTGFEEVYIRISYATKTSSYIEPPVYIDQKTFYAHTIPFILTNMCIPNVKPQPKGLLQ